MSRRALFLRIHTVYEENYSKKCFKVKVFEHLKTKKAGLKSLICLGSDLMQFAHHISIVYQEEKKLKRQTSNFLKFSEWSYGKLKNTKVPKTLFFVCQL